MRIEDLNDQILKTLNLGCFPRNILSFQDSQDFFQQLVFIDYQLQLLIQNEFDGNELIPANIYLSKGHEATTDKLGELISYAENVTMNYNDMGKSYHEKLYSCIILSHLYFLNSQKEQMFDVLNSVTVNTNHYSEKMSFNCNSFLNYLICRYNVLIGISNGYDDTNYRLWIEYLFTKETPFTMSEVAGNYWLEILFKYLSLTISNNGEKQLEFKDLLTLKFKDNRNSFIRYCNFLVNFKLDINVNKIVTQDFRMDYARYLNDVIVAEMQVSDKHFPNANEPNTMLDDFVNNLYSTIKGKRLISLKTSKKFLISLFERSFQSQIILSNYIKVLLDLNEYDEAFAAFKTYIDYVEKEEAINKGTIYDILNIVEIYSLCLIKFNPINSIRTDKFKFLKPSQFASNLKEFSDKLASYLDVLKSACSLNYDDDENFQQFAANKLSFLYTKYNINILLNDKSDLIEMISKAWFSLGYLQYYYLVYESPNHDTNAKSQALLRTYYKNSLIINSTGNLTYLYNYALILSYFHETNPSLKLCKFILKKFPESFETWNLLSLLTSIDNIKESEKFINNALNIAGIYTVKCKTEEIQIPASIKYQILQLKLTQLAILESLYDTKFIMDLLSDVFILYYELFDIRYDEQVGGGNYTIDTKWSHRPSFIDPRPQPPSKSGANKVSNGNSNAKEAIKKISKVRDKGELKTLSEAPLDDEAKKMLQNIWLWTSKIYAKCGYLEESEMCIVESENAYKPNVRTYIQLGYISSKQSKFLSLQEFEKSLEKLDQEKQVNKLDYLENLLGICKLFLVDDTVNNSLFISVKDRDSGVIRLKNLLEKFLNVWPIGNNSIELWYYLSIIYEKLDDKILLTKSLEKCIELENVRPVRSFSICDQNFF